MAQRRGQNLLVVTIVVEKGKLEQVKDFLQFSKLVLNVVVMVKLLVHLVIFVVVTEKYKVMKTLPSKYLKV